MGGRSGPASQVLTAWVPAEVAHPGCDYSLSKDLGMAQNHLFDCGAVFVSKGIVHLCGSPAAAHEIFAPLLERHCCGDFGVAGEEIVETNLAVLAHEGEIRSTYLVSLAEDDQPILMMLTTVVGHHTTRFHLPGE